MRPRTRAVLAAIAVLIVAAVCIRLGFWQLDRLEQRRAQNAAIEAAERMPPLAIGPETLVEFAARPEEFVHRRASVRGVYLHDRELLLRGRAYQGRPGVHLVTPLAIEGNAVLLLNRGWIPSADAATVDPRPYREPGPVTLQGVLQLVPDVPEGPMPAPVAVDDTTITTYRRLDRATLSRTLGQTIPPLYLQVTSAPGAPPALPVPVPPPAPGDGPHLGYALQWFSFAVIAVVGFLVVVIRRGR